MLHHWVVHRETDLRQTLKDVSCDICRAWVENFCAVGDSSQVHRYLINELIFHLVSIEGRESAVRVLHVEEPLFCILNGLFVLISEVRQDQYHQSSVVGIRCIFKIIAISDASVRLNTLSDHVIHYGDEFFRLHS